MSEDMQQQVIDILKTCYDPEIPVNIYQLGLIYDVDISADKVVQIRMTLTSPNCPVSEMLPLAVEQKVESIPEVKTCRVEIVWDPPWSPSMMDEAAKLQLGLE